MRQIGSIADEREAAGFGDYLLSIGIRNTVEPAGASGGWDVWVENDDDLEAARKELDTFRRIPTDSRYQEAGRRAEALRAEEGRAEEKRRRKFIDVRTQWGGQQRQGVAPLTIILIAACLAVGAATRLTREWHPVKDRLHVNSLESTERGEWLGDVRRGQVWRLVTPTLPHQGAIHLLFNMFWLFDLGSLIERRRGTWFLLALVLTTAVLSNLTEYAWAGPFFGGMSGVVYGLFGYAWMKGRLDPASGVGVRPDTVLIMLAWLVFCMTGYVGPVANAAHVGGLVVGMAFGSLPAGYRTARRRLGR